MNTVSIGEVPPPGQKGRMALSIRTCVSLTGTSKEKNCPGPREPEPALYKTMSSLNSIAVYFAPINVRARLSVNVFSTTFPTPIPTTEELILVILSGVERSLPKFLPITPVNISYPPAVNMFIPVSVATSRRLPTCSEYFSTLLLTSAVRLRYSSSPVLSANSLELGTPKSPANHSQGLGKPGIP